MKKSPLAPRNPVLVPALMRQAGAHGKSKKALRREAQMQLLREFKAFRGDRSDEGGSGSGSRCQAHASGVCFAA
ncbi:hypothetical protein [Niveibacterium sp. SC-1]|uniref:hypothetical protein n=1 Tax=Niveibacterium sp. SC-1 TaxID=3135646 RepID=UPI0031202102